MFQLVKRVFIGEMGLAAFINILAKNIGKICIEGWF